MGGTSVCTGSDNDRTRAAILAGVHTGVQGTGECVALSLCECVSSLVLATAILYRRNISGGQQGGMTRDQLHYAMTNPSGGLPLTENEFNEVWATVRRVGSSWAGMGGGGVEYCSQPL